MIFSMADMSGAIPSTIYRRMVTQTQRKAPTARLLSQIGAFRRGDTGNTMTWNVKFSGQDAGVVNLDGGSFRTAVSDTPVSASLVYGSYGAPLKVTDRFQWMAGPNAGLGMDINSLADPWMINLADGVQAWVKLVNQHVYSGSGSSNQMVGLATAIASSGTYANIAAATYSQWASTVTANGGVLQNLTLARVKTLLRTVATNSALGRPDIAICQPAVFDAWENLFDAYARINVDLGNAPMPSAGAERVSIQPAMITLPGGQIKTDGFRVMYWQTARLWIIEDPDAVDTGATNANNSIFFLNSADVEVDYVPPPGNSEFRTDHKTIAAAEQDMGALATMPLDLAKRGRTQYADEWDITGVLGVRLNSRNSHAKLQDQQ